MSMIGNLLRVTNQELDDYLNDCTLLEDRIYNSTTDDNNLLDIDKSWDGIHFLLTGNNLEDTSHPLSKFLFSGQVINEEQDLGYGPAQYLTSEQVKEVNDLLVKISVDDLRKKYNPSKMSELEIYPNSWQDEDEIEYLLHHYLKVQEIYALAAKNQEAIITFIN